MSGEVKVTILNDGIGSLLNRSIDLFGVNTEKFIIGDDYNFVPDPSETSPRGNITFIGSRDAIKSKYFDDDASLRISFIIGEDYDKVSIGNIIGYSLYRGSLRPFISIVLPSLVIKDNANPEGINLGFPYAGNRMIISVTVKYINSDEIDASYTVNIISPSYANLPSYDSDLHVPDAVDNPYEQFIVNRFVKHLTKPAFVTKDESNEYYASPLFQNINSPKYGILDGGDTSNDRIKWIWGGMYSWPKAWFNGSYGGSNYTSVAAQTIVLGGSTYK